MSLAARLRREDRTGRADAGVRVHGGCLHDPDEGYYATRPALGERGDFLTAPLVSQMFGEIVAGWVHAVWEGLGARPDFAWSSLDRAMGP